MKQNSLRLLLFSTILMSSSLMCSLFGPATVNITDKAKQATVDSLQLTVAVLEKQVVTPTFEPTTIISLPTMVKPTSGSISGLFSFPSEGIPQLKIVAIKVDTGEYFATEVTEKETYKLDGLPVGKYHVLAYPADTTGLDKNLTGGYSQSVICGLTADCTDHTLVDVEVTGEAETTNINPTDWYAPAGLFPADPTK
jgi:hypothetical protein